MSEREKFYDEVIAPALLEIGRKCEEAGLSFVAAVEYEQGEYGSTTTLRAGSGFGMRLVDLAVRANGNVDALMIALSRHAEEHGHSSLVLSMLGRMEP